MGAQRRWCPWLVSLSGICCLDKVGGVYNDFSSCPERDVDDHFSRCPGWPERTYIQAHSKSFYPPSSYGEYQLAPQLINALLTTKTPDSGKTSTRGGSEC